MSPDASVSKVLLPLQLRRVEMRSPPPVMTSPPAIVEEAEVEVTPKVPAETPPTKVEVAEEVALKDEAEINPPATRLLRTSRRPESEEVAERLVTEKIPAKELVAVVEVAVKKEELTEPATTAVPWTPRVVPGEEVPTPTLPFERTVRAVVVAPTAGTA